MAAETSQPSEHPRLEPVRGGVGLMRRRGPMVLAGEEFGPTRLWGLLFVSRHVVIVLLAAGVGLLPEFGDDRPWISLILLLGVLPYDIGVHVYARRRRHLPVTMPFVYAPLPAAFVVAFPAVWIPALIAALGNLTLFAITFDVRIALASGAVSSAAFAVAAAVADPAMPWAGTLSFALVSAAVVLGVGALLDTLNLSEQRYRDYVENANDMIYVHDLQGTFLSANETALRMTGYSRAEFGKANAAEIVAPDYLAEVWSRIERAIARGPGDADTVPWELEIVSRDGRRIPVEVNTRVVFHRGRAVAIQGIARDVSERRQVEAELARLDRARSEFIANAAHELRTPLTTLAGLASVLAGTREQTAEEDLVEGLQALARQGRRVQALADRLLDLSILELGGMEMARDPVVLLETLEQALEDAPAPEGRSVEVAVGDEVKVLGDPLHVREILANLLANAYRYGGPSIRASAWRSDDGVEIAVEDDGGGVPDDLVPRLFEPFTRGDQEGGTGLGLTICARLAESLGGELRHEPREPSGARFVLRLPAAH